MRSKRVIKCIRAVLRALRLAQRDLRDAEVLPSPRVGAQPHANVILCSRTPARSSAPRPPSTGASTRTASATRGLLEDGAPSRSGRAGHRAGARSLGAARHEEDARRIPGAARARTSSRCRPRPSKSSSASPRARSPCREIGEQLGFHGNGGVSARQRAPPLPGAAGGHRPGVVVAMVAQQIVPVAGIAMREDPADGASPQVPASAHAQRMDDTAATRRQLRRRRPLRAAPRDEREARPSLKATPLEDYAENRPTPGDQAPLAAVIPTCASAASGHSACRCREDRLLKAAAAATPRCHRPGSPISFADMLRDEAAAPRPGDLQPLAAGRRAAVL